MRAGPAAWPELAGPAQHRNLNSSRPKLLVVHAWLQGFAGPAALARLFKRCLCRALKQNEKACGRWLPMLVASPRGGWREGCADGAGFVHELRAGPQMQDVAVEVKFSAGQLGHGGMRWKRLKICPMPQEEKGNGTQWPPNARGSAPVQVQRTTKWMPGPGRLNNNAAMVWQHPKRKSPGRMDRASH